MTILAATSPENPLDIDGYKLCQELVKHNGSDLHLAADNPPIMRLHGLLGPVEGYPVLSAEDIKQICIQLVGSANFKILEEKGDLDRAISLEGGYRLRINAYRQQETYALAIRLLPNRFFKLSDLGLPMHVLESICDLQSGLILVTGATSSGKSSTIASIVNRINQERACHILTIEDPIEYKHVSNKAFVSQREVERDTDSFSEALRRAMRQDPDVVVIGEMRDLDTMTAAMTLAETGHLTFATLHTSSAVSTITRIVSAYPAAQQAQARIQLADSLQFVISQKLLTKENGKGLSLAAEILVVTPAVRALVRESKGHQIKTAMQTFRNLGMQTLNQSLHSLVNKGEISYETALKHSEEKREFEMDSG